MRAGGGCPRSGRDPCGACGPFGCGKGHARKQPGAESGFTLVELLVAMSIATVVVLAAYAALTGGVTVYNRAGSASEEVQVVRALVDRLTRELQATYFNPQAPDARFVGEEAEGTVGAGGSTAGTTSTNAGTAGTSSASSRTLGTSSVSRSSVGTSSPGAGTAGASSVNASTAGARLTFATAAGLSPLAEVEYFLQEPDPEAGTPGGLYRREKFLLDRQFTETYVPDTDSAEEAVLVAPEVVGFEVAYYDTQSLGTGSLGLRGSLTGDDGWQTSWDAAAQGYLPQAVRVTFSLGSWPRAEDGGVTGVRRITFVVALPLAQAQTSAESSSGTPPGSSTQPGSGS